MAARARTAERGVARANIRLGRRAFVSWLAGLGAVTALDGHRRAARMVDKILKGANPAEMPVQEPTQFLFSVNLSAARRIGVTIPNSVLLQATEVIQ
jgi:hypothetical protein